MQPAALNRLLGQALPIHRIEDAALPLYIVTTDLLSGVEAVLSSGELEQALLASAAIPRVFPCVQIASQLLIDGGVAATQLTQPPRGLVALVLHAVNLMSMRQLASDIEHFRTLTSLHIVPPFCALLMSQCSTLTRLSLCSSVPMSRPSGGWKVGGGLNAPRYLVRSKNSGFCSARRSNVNYSKPIWRLQTWRRQ